MSCIALHDFIDRNNCLTTFLERQIPISEIIVKVYSLFFKVIHYCANKYSDYLVGFELSEEAS